MTAEKIELRGGEEIIDRTTLCGCTPNLNKLVMLGTTVWRGTW